MNGPPGTLYDGEEFLLQFKFGAKYPFDSPEVTFTGNHIPVHPHIYSNGHICLSILTEDWSPALSVEAVCLSIMSMLASAKEKVSVMIHGKIREVAQSSNILKKSISLHDSLVEKSSNTLIQFSYRPS